jgi:hypothetical protein
MEMPGLPTPDSVGRVLSEDVSRDDVSFAVRVGLGVLVRGSCAGLGPRLAAFALAEVILGG